MPIANLISTMNWARMSSSTGGTGALTLEDVAGYRNFRQAVNAVTGSFSVDYVIVASNGMREAGTGTYNAATNVLTRPTTVDDAFTPGVGNGTARVSLPTSGVVIGFDVKVQDVQEVSALAAGKQDGSTKLSALSALTWAANQIILLTGAATASVLSVSAFVQGLFGSADAAAFRTAIGVGTGGGDASTNTTTSVDSEMALFSGTAGKTLKRAAFSGLVKLTSGVASAAVAGTDYLAASTKNAAIGALTWAADTMPYFTGTSAAATTSLTAFGRQLAGLADLNALKTLLGYSSMAPTGVGDMIVSVDGTTSSWRTPTQVRTNLGVSDKAAVPYNDAAPVNGDVSWVLRMPFGGTVNSLTHKLGSGAVTAAVKINSTAITGLSAVAPTSTKTTTNATAANTFAIGDELNITFSGASSAANLAMTLNVTKTGA